jgi:hypothetical protein
MVIARPRAIDLWGKFKLELNVLTLDRFAANRAGSAATSPSPGALGPAGGQLPGPDRLADLLTQCALIAHLADVLTIPMPVGIQVVRRQTGPFGFLKGR